MNTSYERLRADMAQRDVEAGKRENRLILVILGGIAVAARFPRSMAVRHGLTPKRKRKRAADWPPLWVASVSRCRTWPEGTAGWHSGPGGG